jgi:hypothetical protein
MKETRARHLAMKARMALAVSLCKTDNAEAAFHINKALLETERALELMDERA